MSAPTLTVVGPSDADLREEAQRFAERCRERAAMWFGIATSISTAFGLNGGGPVAEQDPTPEPQPERKSTRQTGRPRTTKAPAPGAPASLPDEPRRRGGRQPKYNEDERSEIADFARVHSVDLAAAHYEVSGFTIRKYMAEFPEAG